jgi:hypothetical protein
LRFLVRHLQLEVALEVVAVRRPPRLQAAAIGLDNCSAKVALLLAA